MRWKLCQSICCFSEKVLNDRTSYNYFISLPLNTEAAQEKFQELKSNILGLDTVKEAKIDETIFINAKKLHLTILVLKLHSNESRQLATQVKICPIEFYTYSKRKIRHILVKHDKIRSLILTYKIPVPRPSYCQGTKGYSHACKYLLKMSCREKILSRLITFISTLFTSYLAIQCFRFSETRNIHNSYKLGWKIHSDSPPKLHSDSPPKLQFNPKMA